MTSKEEISHLKILRIETTGDIDADWSTLMIQNEGQALKRQMKINEMDVAWVILWGEQQVLSPKIFFTFLRVKMHTLSVRTLGSKWSI